MTVFGHGKDMVFTLSDMRSHWWFCTGDEHNIDVSKDPLVAVSRIEVGNPVKKLL